VYLFLELIEPKASLFAMAVEGRYINTWIQYNAMQYSTIHQYRLIFIVQQYRLISINLNPEGLKSFTLIGWNANRPYYRWKGYYAIQLLNYYLNNSCHWRRLLENSWGNRNIIGARGCSHWWSRRRFLVIGGMCPGSPRSVLLYDSCLRKTWIGE